MRERAAAVIGSNWSFGAFRGTSIIGADPWTMETAPESNRKTNRGMRLILLDVPVALF
jgi:hypothetical protein